MSILYLWYEICYIRGGTEAEHTTQVLTDSHISVSCLSYSMMKVETMLCPHHSKSMKHSENSMDAVHSKSTTQKNPEIWPIVSGVARRWTAICSHDAATGRPTEPQAAEIVVAQNKPHNIDIVPVMHLAEPFHGSGRNITMVRYYMSIKLVKERWGESLGCSGVKEKNINTLTHRSNGRIKVVVIQECPNPI